MDEIKLVEDLTDEDHYNNLLAIIDYGYSKWDRFQEEMVCYLGIYRNVIMNPPEYYNQDIDDIKYHLYKINAIVGYKISFVTSKNRR